MKNAINQKLTITLLTTLVLSGVSLKGFGQWNSNGSKIYYNNGYVGIGTITPKAKLDIVTADSGGDNIQEMFRILQTNQNTLKVNMYGGSTDLVQLAAVNGEQNIAIVTESSSALNASTNKGIYIKSGGNVGIGTINPTDKLTVNGKIIAEEIEVVVDVPADYVFEEGYVLKSLEEVEAYINQEGHLPDIPSAETIKTEGWQVGEMSNKLLEKVEELTLYLIDQEKRMNALEARNQTLEAQVQALKE